MVHKNVKTTFERCANSYDHMIERVIPYYHEQHELIAAHLPFPALQKIKVLDLGIGTGTLSRVILQCYPRATVHGVDFSANMIDVCAHKLRHFKDRLTFTCGDIEKVAYDRDYDVVVAGLCLHHLPDPAKKRFFKKMYAALNCTGIFVIRDLIVAESKRMNTLYRERWRAFQRHNGIDPDVIEKNSRQNDIPTTVGNHLTWLSKAGFRDADCVWKYMNLAVFIACK